jgi:hypothetical protein
LIEINVRHLAGLDIQSLLQLLVLPDTVGSKTKTQNRDARRYAYRN